MRSHDQWLVSSAILGIGIVTFCLCLPLIYHKVPMNRFYGIRIPQSFVSPERWYEINVHGGRIMARWSVLITFTGMIGLLVPLRFFPYYAVAAPAVVLVSLFAPLFQIIRWARATR